MHLLRLSLDELDLSVCTSKTQKYTHDPKWRLTSLKSRWSVFFRVRGEWPLPTFARGGYGSIVSLEQLKLEAGKLPLNFSFPEAVADQLAQPARSSCRAVNRRVPKPSPRGTC